MFVQIFAEEFIFLKSHFVFNQAAEIVDPALKIDL